MNNKQLYVPNHEKWLKFYEKLDTSEHPDTLVNGRRARLQTGRINREDVHQFYNSDRNTNAFPKERSDKTPIKLNLVTPSQQTVEQAKSEIRREEEEGEEEERGIKGKRKSTANHKAADRKKKKKKKGTSTGLSKNGNNQF